jgi:hypothetical protein
VRNNHFGVVGRYQRGSALSAARWIAHLTMRVERGTIQPRWKKHRARPVSEKHPGVAQRNSYSTSLRHTSLAVRGAMRRNWAWPCV